MDIPFLGEIASLITAISFGLTATFFTFAGRIVGSEMVNRSRLLAALVLLAIVHQLLYGTLVPLDATGSQWFWLGISGIIGLAFGDAFLFQSYLIIGPRLGMLLMSLAPVIASVLGWWFLDERLTWNQIGGIALTIAGIAWVIGEKRNETARNDEKVLNASRSRSYPVGVLLGLLAATGQAVGMILAKQGMIESDISAISANLIRILAAASIIWVYYGFRGKIPESIEKIRQHPKMRYMLLAGTITGPVIGVSFSMLAIQFTAVGVASTLIATTPVFMLPLGYFVFKERFGWQAILGTMLTIAGIWLLFSG